MKNTELTKDFERQGSNGNAAILLPNAVNFSSLSNAPRSCNSETALSTVSKLGGFRSLDSTVLALSWLCIYIILINIKIYNIRLNINIIFLIQYVQH